LKSPRFPIRARRRLGRCYELSYLNQGRAEENGRLLLLIHGTVRGQQGRIDHAWLLDEELGMVYESTLEDVDDKDRWFVKSDYVRCFAAVAERRYDRIAAMKALAATGHSGPWHPLSWER
jgi:hypothetical protein